MNTVLITGASSGIGKETAKTLINEGFTVYGAARRVEKMDDLKQFGGIPIRMDITQEEDLVSTIDRINSERGGVDILINNAGSRLYGSIEETTMAEARYQFEVNLFGAARLTQLALPYMREQQAGKIINISSGAGKIYTALGAWYTATKHALEGWSDCLRFEVEQFNIDVVVIEPGAIKTDKGEFTDAMLERSGSGPYANIAKGMARMLRGMQHNPDYTSPPSVIANTILKAIRADRPKTRYAAGKLVKKSLFIRKWFGDRVFDRQLAKIKR